jgi:hypothetical protein
MSNEELQSWFEVLDNIRESGAMNMFAAPRFLETECGLSRADARAVFAKWTESFTNRQGEK